MSTLNPTHLKTFLAVAQHMSFTRAADEVCLSQPAVSRQIQQLERDLKTPLFEHIGRTLHLTDAGRTLVPEAQQLLANLERLAESVAAYGSLEMGTLRIGAGTTPGFYMLPDLLGWFHRRFRGVEIDYVVENSQGIEQKILRNEIDLGFVGAQPTSGDILHEPVAVDEIICVAGRTHPLAKRKRIAPSLLEAETWIVRRRGSATRALFEAWLRDIGVSVGRTIELGCPEAVRSLVAAGIGFSYMSHLAAAQELRRKRLARLPVTGLRLTRPIYLIRHTDKHLTPAMQAFLRHAKAVLARRPNSSNTT